MVLDDRQRHTLGSRHGPTLVRKHVHPLCHGVGIVVHQERDRDVTIPRCQHAVQRGSSLLSHNREQADIRLRVEVGVPVGSVPTWDTFQRPARPLATECCRERCEQTGQHLPRAQQSSSRVLRHTYRRICVVHAPIAASARKASTSSQTESNAARRAGVDSDPWLGSFLPSGRKRGTLPCSPSFT